MPLEECLAPTTPNVYAVDMTTTDSHTDTLTVTISVTHDADEAPYTTEAIGDILTGICHLDATVAEVDPLVAAYHAAFDAKDAAVQGTDAFVAGYNAAAAIGRLIEATGGTIPVRFDPPVALRVNKAV